MKKKLNNFKKRKVKQIKFKNIRKNKNMLIFGTSGTGKSTLAKSLIPKHLGLGRKVIIVDPEREYKNLCIDYSGNYIDVCDETTGRINPLQIFTTLEDSTTPDNKAIVSNHISFLGGWFEILFPEIDKSIVKCFTSSLLGLYENKTFNTLKSGRDMTTLEADDYPIIDDLIEYVRRYTNLHTYDQKFVQLLDLLKLKFQGNGQYSKLYNGHSTIKESSNSFVVFDINTLFEKRQQNIIHAQLYLLTAFISNEVNDNFLDDDKQIVVLIDEAHLLIDKSKTSACEFIYQTLDKIVNSNGLLTLVLQNSNDFSEFKKRSNDFDKNTIQVNLDRNQFMVIENERN